MDTLYLEILYDHKFCNLDAVRHMDYISWSKLFAHDFEVEWNASNPSLHGHVSQLNW